MKLPFESYRPVPVDERNEAEIALATLVETRLKEEKDKEVGALHLSSRVRALNWLRLPSARRRRRKRRRRKRRGLFWAPR